MRLMLSVILCIIIAILLVMIGFVSTRKGKSSVYYFVGVCAALLFYALGYVLELNATNLPSVWGALQVENIGIPALAPFFLLTMMQLCHSRFLRGWMGLLAVIHIAFVILVVVTNPLHHLFYTSVDAVFGDWTVSVLGKGPLYFYNQAVTLVCSITGYVVLFRRFVYWTPRRRRQMMLLVIGTFFTLAGNIINIVDALRLPFDILPFACCITLIFMFANIAQNRLYDLVPIALERATQTMDDAMVVLDPEMGYLYANDAAFSLFGGLSQVPVSTPVTRVNGWPKELMGNFTNEERNFQLETVNGTRSFRCNTSPVTRPDGEKIGWSILLHDISETVTLLHQLEQLAITDSLTGLYNRRQFMFLAEQEMRRAQRHAHPISFIMFDLDHFKLVNDTYGHAAGDHVLVVVANVVQMELRTSDVFGRYGGEEFLILLPETSCEGAEAFAQRLLRVLAALPIYYKENYFSIQASFGVTEAFPGDTLNEAINTADRAMYAAKTAGRNCVRVANTSGGSPSE